MFSNTATHHISYALNISQYGHHLWHSTLQGDTHSTACQEMVSTELLTHSAVLTILSCDSYCAPFLNKLCCLETPKRKNLMKYDLEIKEARELGPLFLSNNWEPPCLESHQ
jgi:hypothetical protein